MYGREQLEADLAWLEEQRAVGARLLVEGKINGFQKLNLDREIDVAEQKCRGKLAGVRMAITDREAMVKSGKLYYWRKRKSALWLRKHGEGEWQVTTQARLDAMRAAGYFLVELKSFPPRDGGAQPTPTSEPAPPLPTKTREVSLEEARMLALESLYTIVWRPEGRECALVVEYA